jgi:hypothetical protein
MMRKSRRSLLRPINESLDKGKSVNAIDLYAYKSSFFTL